MAKKRLNLTIYCVFAICSFIFVSCYSLGNVQETRSPIDIESASFVGRTERELRTTKGVPNRVDILNQNIKYLIYDDSTSTSTGASSQTTFSGNKATTLTGASTSFTNKRIITFEITDDKVTGYKLEGYPLKIKTYKLKFSILKTILAIFPGCGIPFYFFPYYDGVVERSGVTIW